MMFGKKKRQQAQPFQEYMAEDRRFRIELARAIANEQMTGEYKEAALKKIAKYEQKER